MIKIRNAHVHNLKHIDVDIPLNKIVGIAGVSGSGKFYHDLKACFKKHPIHKEILEKMGFPENWERIGRIKKYIKSEMC